MADNKEALPDIVDRLRDGVFGLNRIPLCEEAASVISELLAEVEQLKAEQIKMKEWAKLAFRVINNIQGPLENLAEFSESTEESEATALLADMAHAVADQYPAILGVNYMDAVFDARAALAGAAGGAG